MGFFDDDDPFGGIFEEFFGRQPEVRARRREQFIRGEDDDRTIDFIEDDEKVYVVFEFPGYKEKEITVTVNGKELHVTAQKSNGENIQNYLHQKLRQGISIQKELPNFVDSKKYSHTVRNGVLEIVFDKIRRGRNKSGVVNID